MLVLVVITYDLWSRLSGSSYPAAEAAWVIDGDSWEGGGSRLEITFHSYTEIKCL